MRTWSAMCLYVLVCSLVSCCFGNVVMVSPPARRLALDFLTNWTDNEPCGMPYSPDESSQTFFVLTEKNACVSISWFVSDFTLKALSYTLQLVDVENGSALLNFPAPPLTDGKALRSHVLCFPRNFSCVDCSIRISRSTVVAGRVVNSHSCADVIVSWDVELFPDCHGHGASGRMGCTCDRRYHGSNCETLIDCEDSSDCSGHAVCLLTDNLASAKQCFCPYDVFGVHCELPSVVHSNGFDADRYLHKQLADNFTLYWRVDVARFEIELIAVVLTRTWVGIGLRSDNVSSWCKLLGMSGVNVSYAESISDLSSAMDCADIYVGISNGSYGMVRDMWTPGTSTPQPDEFYGGKSNLIGAMAYQNQRSQTVLRIVRPLITGDMYDCPVDSNELDVIWAVGQTGAVFDPLQLTYHGPTGRGHVRMSLWPQRVAISYYFTLATPRKQAVLRELLRTYMQYEPIDMVSFSYAPMSLDGNATWICLDQDSVYLSKLLTAFLRRAFNSAINYTTEQHLVASTLPRATTAQTKDNSQLALLSTMAPNGFDDNTGPAPFWTRRAYSIVLVASSILLLVNMLILGYGKFEMAIREDHYEKKKLMWFRYFNRCSQLNINPLTIGYSTRSYPPIGRREMQENVENLEHFYINPSVNVPPEDRRISRPISALNIPPHPNGYHLPQRAEADYRTIRRSDAPIGPYSANQLSASPQLIARQNERPSLAAAAANQNAANERSQAMVVLNRRLSSGSMEESVVDAQRVTLQMEPPSDNTLEPAPLVRQQYRGQRGLWPKRPRPPSNRNRSSLAQPMVTDDTTFTQL